MIEKDKYLDCAEIATDLAIAQKNNPLPFIFADDPKIISECENYNLNWEDVNQISLRRSVLLMTILNPPIAEASKDIFKSYKERISQ